MEIIDSVDIAEITTIASEHSNSAIGITLLDDSVKPEGFTYRIMNTKGGDRDIIITNHTPNPIPKGWSLQFDFRGFKPKTEAPAIPLSGSGGKLKAVVDRNLNTHETIVIPISAAGSGPQISNLSVNGILAKNESI
jgi:hypothetical protein